MKKVAQKIVILCSLLCVAGMDARRFSAINAAALPVYVGLFSVAGNEITDAAKRPVYKLPKSGRNRAIKPYAVFDFYGDANQKFIFSANLAELDSVLESAQIPADTVFSTLFTYQPETQEPNTLFEIQSERVNSSGEAITQRLLMKPLGPKAHLGSLHVREEVNLTRRKETERFLRSSSQPAQEPVEQVPQVNIVEQRSALHEERVAVGDGEQGGGVMFHIGGPTRKVITLVEPEQQAAEIRATPARSKSKRWPF